MHGFAAYDIVKARRINAGVRATTVARHADAVAARRRGRTRWTRLALIVAPAPAARPACCAA